ncbi:MAG: argininosuccinate synthase, partial [Pseudomonadota bacterium]|nr:argininosuccinate synthase [Pseudomonadota bacterium]
MLHAAIDLRQSKFKGTLTQKLYKCGVHVTGRRSRSSLYSANVVTFEDDAGAYDQRDAEGFVKLNALRLRLLGRRDRV